MNQIFIQFQNEEKSLQTRYTKKNNIRLKYSLNFQLVVNGQVCGSISIRKFYIRIYKNIFYHLLENSISDILLCKYLILYVYSSLEIVTSKLGSYYDILRIIMGYKYLKYGLKP